MLDELLHLLNSSSVIHNPQIVELIAYGQDAFRVKIRAQVAGDLTLQIWLNHNDRRTRYSHQLFRHDQPILRWDNAPHHPEQATNFPHHFHDEQGRLVHSPLSGAPLADLALILRQIEDYLRQSGQA